MLTKAFESSAEYTQVADTQLFYRGVRPRILGLPSLVSQCNRSVVDAEIEPTDGVSISSQFFGAGASLNLQFEAKVFGPVELLTERPEGAVCGSLAIKVQAALRGGLKLVDSTKGGLCAKEILIVHAQELPVTLRIEGGINLFQSLQVEIDGEGQPVKVSTSGREFSTPSSAISVRDERQIMNSTTSSGCNFTAHRLITLQSALPQSMQ